MPGVSYGASNPVAFRTQLPDERATQMGAH